MNSNAKRIAEDRAADLHYAFQFGEDFARRGDIAIEQEFKAKFSGDAEAQAEFARGVAHRNCHCDLRTMLVGDGCEVCNPKLAADLAADSVNVTKEGVEVRAGQVWRDLDKRMSGGNRHCKVDAVRDGKAIMHRCTAEGRITSSKADVKVSIRMHKSSTGWALVQDVR